MIPPTPSEYEAMLDVLLRDHHAAQNGDRLTHWEKTRAFLIDAYRDVWAGGGVEWETFH